MLQKKGFKHDDPLAHECGECHEHAVQRFVLLSRLGGRDIDICAACGRAWSWSRRAGKEEREPDLAFDLEKFLG